MPPNTTGEARSYPRPLPNAAWLGKLTEEILEPDLPIVSRIGANWGELGSESISAATRTIISANWGQSRFPPQSHGAAVTSSPWGELGQIDSDPNSSDPNSSR